MANKTVQYYNKLANIWNQFPEPAGLTTEDIKLRFDYAQTLANVFRSVKTSTNDIYILCGCTGDDYYAYLKVIKIDKFGIKTIIQLTNLGAYQSRQNQSDSWWYNMILSRDEKNIYFNRFSQAGAYVSVINLDNFVNDGATTTGIVGKFTIYQDRYIWAANGTTLSILNYETKALIVEVNTTVNINCISCSINNELYFIHTDQGESLTKATFNGISTITFVSYTPSIELNQYVKQLIIDKWGDLIILTNSGTVSTLLKYSTTGIWIDTLDATFMGDYGTCVYNLYTDSLGIYGWSNALGTYEMSAHSTTGKGQLFSRSITKTRNGGITIYGSDPSGYNVSKHGSVGC